MSLDIYDQWRYVQTSSQSSRGPKALPMAKCGGLGRDRPQAGICVGMVENLWPTVQLSKVVSPKIAGMMSQRIWDTRSKLAVP